jgi:hypothetical protein
MSKTTEEHPIIEALEDWLRSPAPRPYEVADSRGGGPPLTVGTDRDLTANPDNSINPLSAEVGGQSSVSLVDSSHPAVSKIARVVIRPGSSNTYGNTVRLLMADTQGGDPAPPTPTLEYTHAFAVRFPSSGNDGGFPRTGLLWELHNTYDWYMYSPGAALAPHAVLLRPNRTLANRYCGGDITPTGWAEWHPEDPLLTNVAADKWINVVHRVKFSESANGEIDVYAWYLGDPTPTTPKVKLRNLKTAQVLPNMQNDRLYLECGFYLDGASSTNRTDTIEHTLPRRFLKTQDAFNWITSGQAPVPPDPPVTHHYASSIKTGDVVTDGQVWEATSDDTKVTKAKFFADNAVLSEQPFASGKASQTLHLAPTSDNGGVTLHDSAGVMLWGSGSIDWTVQENVLPPEPETETYELSGTVSANEDGTMSGDVTLTPQVP